MIREVFPLAIAGEVRKTANSLLDRRPRGAVTDPQDPHLGPPTGHDRQRVRQIIDVLLRCDATHVGDHDVVRGPSQRPADRRATGPAGPKKCTINSALPQDEPLEAQALELRDRCLRWDVGLPRVIVKPAQIAPDHRPGPAHPVIPAVLIEIGMKTGNNWHAPPQGPDQDAQAERCLGGNMNHVRPKRFDRSMCRPEGGKWKMQLLVKRQHDRPHGTIVIAVDGHTIVGVH
jgi:hypothetical protein